MKWSWRKAFGLPLPIPPAEPIAPKPSALLNLTMQQVIEAVPPKAPSVTLEEMFAPYPAMPGVVPKVTRKAAIAMDELPAVISNPTAAFGSLYQNALHEGLYFLGYPYLAQLALRAEYRHAAEIWAEHATRKWIKLRGPENKLKLILAEFDRLDVRGVFNAVIEKDALFGRSQVFLDFDDFDNRDELVTDLTLSDAKISKSRPLKRLRVIEPMWTSPAPYNTSNPLAPDFYVPSAWYVYGREISATRLLTIVGRPVPDMLKPAFAFGGQSLTALMKPYVDNWLRSRQSASDLLHAFSVMVFHTKMEDYLQPGAMTSLATRMALFTRYRDNNGAFVVDEATEDLTNVSAPIAGVEGLVAQAQEQMASAARIPLSIYLQITPTGLNASSENEVRSFYADILGYNEANIRPPLQTVLDVVQLSLFGVIDQKVTFTFEPLWEMSDKDRAEVIAKEAQADAAYVEMGAVDNEEVRERLRNEEDGFYAGVDLSGSAPEPENGDGADDDDDEDDAARSSNTGG